MWTGEAYAREHVRFLVLQLDQWSKEFPQQFYAALMRPPVDSSKLSEAAKAGPGELGESIKRLAALSGANDVLTNAEFRNQLREGHRVLQGIQPGHVGPAVPRAFTKQLGPDAVHAEQPGSRLQDRCARGVGTSGRRRWPRRTRWTRSRSCRGVAPGGGLVGYIVDLACAKRGKGMWTNAQCVERCVRDGDKVVLVTEDGKIFQISNQDKITADSYGQVVTLTGKTDGDTITVDSLKL